MFVYMQVTKDKYELPIAVADSVKMLSIMRHVKEGSIYNAMHEAKIRGTRCKYIKVDIGDEDE